MNNNIILSEQESEFKMPGQLEFYGYRPNKPETLDLALKNQKDYFNKIRRYVNFNLEDDLRDFLYSPEGIATIAGIDYVGGAPISMLLFSILVSYDIKKWIDLGEPNWLFLITDLICVGTAGFASSIASPLLKAAKNIKFKSLSSFFIYISKNFKTMWENFVLPMAKTIEKITSKIIPTVTKEKSFLSGTLSSSLSNITSYLSKLNSVIKESLDKVIGKAGTEVAKTWANYKVKSTLAGHAFQTETGKKLLKKSLPYVNPMLGSDKIEPFLIDLISNPRDVNSGNNLNNYEIHAIFRDNSKDTF
jgi:hypothetical protein